MEKENNENSNVSEETLTNHYQNETNNNRVISSQPPYDGQVDKLGEVRLRMGMVSNPELFRTSNETKAIDPINMERIFNFNTGMVAVNWIGLPGGIIRPQERTSDSGSSTQSDQTNSQSWKNNFKEAYGDVTKIHPEDKTYAEWDVPSRREMLQLTHPFIWSNDVNYCGINYIPPVGSLVVVGFRKHEIPVILGYVNNHYRICKPVLNPGETIIKGYGNNWVHCRWSDKLDLHARSVKGEKDLDCNVGQEITNEEDCTLWIRLNANDQTLTISAAKNISDHPYEAPYSLIKLTPKNITMMTKVEDDYSQYFQDSKNVTIETETCKIKARKLIKMNAPKIEQN